ncbi:MAG: hypothetical protein K1X94_19200 [Sandaracinaceae bacterium]|nr:hypothetical protein [Sandaracinaceae bacterium]
MRARTAIVAWLVTSSLATGCEGELGRIARGESPPTLRPGTDAAVSAPDARTPSSLDASGPPSPDAAVVSPDAAAPPTGCGSATEQAVIALANAARSSMGLASLTCDPQMTVVARAHSQDMCDRGYFSHTGLDGRSPFDRLSDGGVRFGAAGENIAQGQRTPDEVHTAWMNSPGHRMNILGSAYRRIGVGLAECGGRMDWTQVFAD